MTSKDICKEDIQRMVVYGLNSDWVRHIILRIESQPQARLYIRELMNKKKIDHAGGIWDAEADKLRWKLNVSFTYQGLQLLQLNRQIVENVIPKLANSYSQGASLRAMEQGDVGESASYNWETGFQSHNAHLVLSIYADDKCNWDEIHKELSSLEGASGLAGWDNIHSAHTRKNDEEVFGFKDGISQPFFRGVSKERKGGVTDTLKFEPGDLLLGYANTIGENFWDDDLLPDDAKNFFQNGTFAALRKIKQDKGKFDCVTAKLADEHDVSPVYIRSKMVGRWPNGAVMEEHQTKQPDIPEDDKENKLNNFGFEKDPLGYGCPFGSHMRRINHRDTPDVFPFQHRAIQRRGKPYGPEADGEEGLLALFICASLKKQFEFVMGDWVEGSPRTHSGIQALTSDPLIGNQYNGEKDFIIPRLDKDGKDASIRLKGLKEFTTTKGMLYLFFPSMTALRRMAILDHDDDEFVYEKEFSEQELYA